MSAGFKHRSVWFIQFARMDRSNRIWVLPTGTNGSRLGSIESLRRIDSTERLVGEPNAAAAVLCPRGDWLHMIPLNVHYLFLRLHSVFIKQKIWRMVLVHVGYLVLPVFGSVRNRGIYNALIHDQITTEGLCVFNAWLLIPTTDLYAAVDPY